MGAQNVWCDECGNPKKWAERSEPCDKCGSRNYDIDDTEWNDRNPSANDEDDIDVNDFVDNLDDESECFD